MNERLRFLGRALIVTAVVADAGYVLYQVPKELKQQEQAIDERCGGPTRPDCERIEESGLILHPAGGASATVFVRYIPKATPTMIVNGERR